MDIVLWTSEPEVPCWLKRGDHQLKKMSPGRQGPADAKAASWEVKVRRHQEYALQNLGGHHLQGEANLPLFAVHLRTAMIPVALWVGWLPGLLPLMLAPMLTASSVDRGQPHLSCMSRSGVGFGGDGQAVE
jgi:hypothetical protein